MTIECMGKWDECLVIKEPVEEDGIKYWEISCPERNECYLKWKEENGRNSGDEDSREEDLK